MKRKYIVWGSLGLIALGYWYLPKLHLADKFAPRIQTELQNALHSKVKFDKVTFNFLTGPGFAVDEVVISDYPEADIEPIAYVSSLEMRVRLLSLLSGHLEFTSLRLVEPSVNLKRSSLGTWNLQPFLSRAMASSATSGQKLNIQVRSGRLNFKLGEQKSVFYITDADVDIEPSTRAAGGLDVVFSGEPARTDRAAQGFGRLTGRGLWKPGAAEPEVEFNVKLQKSSIGEITILMAGRDFGIHGLVAGDARLSGPISNIAIESHAELSDIHRWDMMAGKSEGWPVDLRGVLDLHQQSVKFEIAPPKSGKSPVALKVFIHDFLSTPRWAALLTLHDLAADPLMAVARHMGVGLPPALSLDGKVEGVLGYSTGGGFQGGVQMSEATAMALDQAPMKIPAAQILVSDTRAELKPARFELAEHRHADLEAAVDFETHEVELKVTTPGLGVKDIEVFSKLLGIGSAPVLANCEEGLWRGVLSYDEDWKGDLELTGAVVALPDLADKVELASAAVQVRGSRFTISRMKGKAGKLHFDGDFQWMPKAHRPARFQLHMAEAPAPELDRLLTPVLRRQQGFIARTLRLNRAPVPDWLSERHAEGVLVIDAFQIAGRKLDNLKISTQWDGVKSAFTEIKFLLDEAKGSGTGSADLAYALPQYRLNGLLEGQAIKVGKDLDAQSVGGKFVFQLERGASNLQATEVELVTGRETYTGQGSSTPDGHLQFDLVNGRKILRVNGVLSPFFIEIAPVKSAN